MFDTIIKIILTLAVAGILFALLPVSPFQSLVAEIGEIPYLGYISWVLPVGKMLKVLTIWATAVGAFYGISWILRQLGIIGS